MIRDLPGYEPNRRKKLLLLTAIGIMSLILLLYFARPLYLPDTYLIRRLQEAVSSASNYQLNIERGKISLYNSAVLEGITLKDPKGTITVSLRELHISYRLLPLFNKRLVVENLLLIDPIINIDKSEVPSDTIPEIILPASKQGMPDSIAAPASIPKKSLKSTIEFALPFAVIIENLQVQNAAIAYLKQKKSDSFETSTSGIDVTGRNIYLHEEDSSHAQFKIEVNDSLRLTYVASNTHLDYRSKIEFSANAAIRLDHSEVVFSLSAKSEVKTASARALLPDVKVSADVRLEDLQALDVAEINLSLGNVVVIDAGLKAQDIFHTATFQAELKDGQVDLEAVFLVLDRFSSLLPGKSFVKLPRIAGRLLLQDSQFHGILTEPDPELNGTLRCRIENGFFRNTSAGFVVSNLDIDAFAEGQFYPLMHVSSNIGLDIKADSLQMSVSLLGNFLTLSALNVGVSAEMQPGMMSPQLSVIWRGGTSFGGELKGDLSCHAERLDFQNPQLSPGFFLDAGCSIDDIDLNVAFPDEIDGLLSLACDLNIKELEGIALSIGSFCPDLRLKRPVGDVNFPPLMTRIEMLGSTDPDFRVFNVPEIHVDLSPYAQIDLSASIRNNQFWDVKIADLGADLNQLLPVLKPVLPGPVKDVDIVGKIVLFGSCQGQGSIFDDDFQSDFQLKSEELYLSLPEQGIAFDSVQFQADFRGNRRNVEVTSVAEIGRLNLSRYRSKPYEAVAVKTSSRFRDFRDFAGGSADINFGDLGLDVRIDVQAAISDRSPLSGLDISYRFESADSVFLLQSLLASGWSDGWCRLTFPADTITKLEGAVTGKELRLFKSEDFDFSELDFRIPFKTELNTGTQKISLISDEQPLSPLDDQVLFNNFNHLYSPELGLGMVKCRNIHIGSYEFSNLDALIEWHQNTIRIPHLTIEAYSGTIRSTFTLRFPSLDPDAVQYRARITGIGLNSAKLPGARPEEGEESEISAFAHFNGQGLDPKSHLELEGGVDITQIGRQVADNIFRFLDPDQNDPSIQTYRNYIRRGWGVKVFSFDVKEDFVYVSVIPARPPLTQLDMFLLSYFVGLGKSITFSRLPLRYFWGQSHRELKP